MEFWQITLIYILPLSAAGIAMLNAIIAWQKREYPGGASLVALMIAVAIWSFTETLSHRALNQEIKILWSQI